MIDGPVTMTRLAKELVDWNDKAAKWLKNNRESNEEDMSPRDEEFGTVTICFRKEDLDLFMKNQEAAAKWLRILALDVAGRDDEELPF